MNHTGKTSFLLPLLLATAGCPRAVHRIPQQVTAATPDSAWVVGSEGYAAFWDASGVSERPYPRRRSAPDWAYEPGASELPAAHLVVIDGEAHLVTRVGDMMRWDGTRWVVSKARVVPEYGDVAQVNQVLALADGRMLVQVHSHTLHLGRPEDFAAGRITTERTPSYFTWIGLAASTLVGIGWDAGGNSRGVYRKGADGVFQLMASLGQDRDIGSPKCALARGDGSLLVVTPYGFVDTRPVRDDDTSFPGLVHVAAPVPSGQALSTKSSGYYIARCFTDGANRALLVMGGRKDGMGHVVEYRAGEITWHRCDADLGYETIGALPYPHTWSIVSRNLEQVDLNSAVCQRAPSPGTPKATPRSAPTAP